MPKKVCVVADLHVDCEMLRRFEAGYDPRHPERSEIPARLLGQGRISTVLAVTQGAMANLAIKRLSIFKTPEEADHYESLHRRYTRTLGERAGLKLMPTTTVRLTDAVPGRVIVYIVQERALEDTACHAAMFHLSPPEVDRLLLTVLQETAKVFDFNTQHQRTLELGFDARLSNWAILGFDPEDPILPQRIRLAYLDTSTPMLRRNGQEQFDTMPLLRGMPAIMPFFVRRSAVNDLISRYYDFRRTVVDLLANLYTEGRENLVSWLTDTTNWFFLAERMEAHFRPLTVAEIQAQHRRDVLYWRSYMMLRRLNRLLGR